MKKVLVFAVKSKEDKMPDVSEQAFSLCYSAAFEYPEKGVCVVKAIIDDNLNTDEIAKTLPMVDYDTSKINTDNIQKECDFINENRTIVVKVDGEPNGL